MSPHEAANILSLLKSLQQDMAEVRDCITALELNDRYMTRIEQHLRLLLPPDIPVTNQSSDMLIDAPVISNSTVTLVSFRPTALPVQTSLNLLSPDFTPSRPVRAPLSAPVVLPETSSPSSTSQTAPSPTQTYNLTLQDSLFSSISPTPSPRNAFNISSFNINGLKTFSHNKIELLNDFFSFKHISFGDVIDTHLHP
ncbi:hypothetical protein RCL_jg156.t1 [Rhizophagus clarus]|uniref:Uncharacterized protein n=1 Tax=Rhizophagus clarus TaxID=94130 RepID=A0A8H3L5Z5_9GLOM|nr:hypothetical protein RCL_jg156.t1 [Rhizophagus clarus]